MEGENEVVESKKLNYVKPTVEEILLSVNERVSACGSVPSHDICGDFAVSGDPNGGFDDAITS
jgi:hypothetical protein